MTLVSGQGKADIKGGQVEALKERVEARGAIGEESL